MISCPIATEKIEKMTPTPIPRVSIIFNRSNDMVRLADSDQFKGFKRATNIQLCVPGVGIVKYSWGAYSETSYHNQSRMGEDARNWYFSFLSSAKEGSCAAGHVTDARVSLQYLNKALASMHSLFYEKHSDDVDEDEDNNNAILEEIWE